MTSIYIKENIEETLNKLSNISISSLSLDFSYDNNEVTNKILEECLRVLEQGGILKITASSKQTNLRRIQILNGFSSIHSDTKSQVPGSKTLLAKKPEFTGTSISLDGTSEQLPTNDGIWTLDSINDVDIGKNNDIISEFDLLKEDVPKPVYNTNPDQPRKRKACKNCTCGQAEQEQDEISANKKREGNGGCGNCAYGDAYRCSTCPSLGRPAWKNIDGTLKLDL